LLLRPSDVGEHGPVQPASPSQEVPGPSQEKYVGFPAESQVVSVLLVQVLVLGEQLTQPRPSRQLLGKSHRVLLMKFPRPSQTSATLFSQMVCP